MKANATFSRRVLKWFDRHGRKHLPWQQDITPYRVFVSEVMLQQTQVATVLNYYDRFIKRFPTVKKLAAAPIDEVLHLWSGLGYYSRARNLHRAAKMIVEEHRGIFPDDVETLSTLPGIGRSTAGAIVSIAFGKQAAILDGNVKRVLARHFAIEGAPTDSQVLKQFWQIAEAHTPAKRCGDYTQAMMDLGATLCTRSKPRCEVCPLQKTCIAHRDDAIDRFPARKASRKTLPLKSAQLLMVCNTKGEVLLEQRPPHGIWGGLWCLPELAADADAAHWCKKELGLKATAIERWPVFIHTFSHFRLAIEPVRLTLAPAKAPAMAREIDKRLWVTLAAHGKAQTLRKGLPKPVSTLLSQLLHSKE